MTVERGSAETKVTIDGIGVSADERVELDPGPHDVVASDRERMESRSIVLARGASAVRVVVAFPAVAVCETSQPSITPSSGPASKVGGLVVTGAGVATLIAGGVVGVLALTKASTARDRLPASCEGTTCLASRTEEIEATLAQPRLFATVADVLFVMGGIAVAVGVYLMIAHPGANPSATPRVSSNARSLEVRF